MTKTYSTYNRAQRAAEDALPGAARMGIDYEIFGVGDRTAWRELSADDFDLATGRRVTPPGGEQGQ